MSIDRLNIRFTDENDDNDDERNIFYHQASSKMLDKSNMEMSIPMGPSDMIISATEDSGPHCLPYLQSVLFACVIEDTIVQIRILDECNNELRIIKTMSDMANLRGKKFQIKHVQDKDELMHIKHHSLGSMQYKLDKLAADRIYCVEVMLVTYLELSLQRCYTSIVESNQDVVNKDYRRTCLVAEEAKNKLCRRDLMKQLRQQRNHIKTVAYDTDIVVDQLKSKVEDAALNTEIRGRYITNWQRSRTEQHQQTILDKEKAPFQSIKYYQLRIDQEQRIHSEVELLVNIFINDTLMKVESWMSKYDTDMEAIDLKIQIMKNKYQQSVDTRIEMEETYAHHEVQMKNWIEFKKEREKARLYVEKMTKCAITVQAWWRGLLVRFELGPYKPKRVPTQAAKAGDKKKKK